MRFLLLFYFIYKYDVFWNCFIYVIMAQTKSLFLPQMRLFLSKLVWWNLLTWQPEWTDFYLRHPSYDPDATAFILNMGTLFQQGFKDVSLGFDQQCFSVNALPLKQVRKLKSSLGSQYLPVVCASWAQPTTFLPVDLPIQLFLRVFHQVFQWPGWKWLLNIVQKKKYAIPLEIKYSDCSAWCLCCLVWNLLCLFQLNTIRSIDDHTVALSTFTVAHTENKL